MMRDLKNEYIEKNPQNYLGYFATGLVELDSYFGGKNIISDSNMEKAAELKKNDKIIKYYFINLLAIGDIKKIKKFEKKYREYLNEYKFKLVLQVLSSLKGNEQSNVIQLYEDRDYDYQDYLILDILQKKDIIENKDENYLYKSIKKGRKTEKLIDAVFKNRIISKEIIDEEMVTKYSEKLLTLSNSREVFTWILHKKLVKNVNKTNLKLVSQIIINNIGNSECNDLINKFEDYCVKTDYDCRYIIERMIKTKKEVNDYNHMVLRYCFFPIEIEISKVIKSNLIKKVHFYSREIDIIRESADEYLLFKYNHIYSLKLDLPLDEGEVQIILSFKNYNNNESLTYTNGVMNFYYLPDEIKYITVILSTGIITVKQGEFKKTKLVSADGKINFYRVAQYISINFKNKELNDKFTLFLYFRNKFFPINNNFVDLYSNLFAASLIFKTEDYFNIVKRIFDQKKYAGFSAQVRSSIDNEYLRLRFSPEVVHSLVMNKDDVEVLINLVLKAQQNGVEIWIRSMLHLIKKAKEKNIYNINLGIICEEFVCTNAIINEDICSYLVSCYENILLNTENTEKTIQIVNIYIKDDSKVSELNLYNMMNKNKYNHDFYTELMNLISKTGTGNKLVYEAVNNMIQFPSYSYDENFFDVLEELYKKNPKNIRLLQELVKKYIDHNMIVPEKYLHILKEFYCRSGVINNDIYNIGLFMIESGMQGIEDFAAGLLSYEFIDCRALPSGDIYIKSHNSVTSKIINDGTQKNICLLLGYSFEFYYGAAQDSMNNIFERPSMKNHYKVFIDWFNKLKDTDFSNFAGEVCIRKDIFNEKILGNYIIQKQQYWSKAATMIIRQKGVIQIEKSKKYILKLIEEYEEIPDELTDILTRFAGIDIETVTKLLISFKEHGFELKIKPLLKIIISKAINAGNLNVLNKVIEDYEYNVIDDYWINIFINYIKNIKYIGTSEYGIMLKLFHKLFETGKDHDFLRAILEIQIDPYEYGLLLYQIYLSKKDDVVRCRFIPILLKYPERCSSGMALDVLKEYFNISSSDEKLCYVNFAYLCNKNRDIIDTILKAAKQYFETDVIFSKALLAVISDKDEEAKSILKSLNSENVTVVKNYSVENQLKEGRTGCLYNAVNIGKNSKAYCLKLNENIIGLVKQYLSKEEIRGVAEEKNWMIFEGSILSEEVSNMNLLQELSIAKSLVTLESILMKNKYCIPNITASKVVVLNQKPISLNLIDVREFNQYCLYNLSVSSKYGTVKNIRINKRLCESDICLVLKRFIVQLLDSRKETDEDYLKVIDIFNTSNNVNTISSLLLLIGDIMNVLKSNSDGVTVSPKKALEMYSLLNDKNKNIVDTYILDNDLYSKEFFEFILHSKLSSDKKLLYLVKYCSDYGNYFKRILDIIKIYDSTEREFQKEEKSNIMGFIRSGIGSGILNQDIIHIIKGIKHFNDSEKQSLNYLIERKSI